MSQPQEQKKEYTFEEDTMITAQAAVNIVLSTKENVDPVPLVAALLDGYARRAQTVYNLEKREQEDLRKRANEALKQGREIYERTKRELEGRLSTRREKDQ